MATREGVRRSMSVFCDETGTHRCAYFAWGSLWCPSERVREFRRDFERLARQCHFKGELGWKFSTGQTFARKLIAYFFQTPWLCFQSFFVHKPDMYIFSGQKRAHVVAFKKLLCTMIATQAAHFDALPGGPREFWVHVDRVGEQRKVAQQEYRIIAASLAKRGLVGRAPLASFRRVDSRTAPGVQLADLLVGAIRACWECPKGQQANPRQRAIQAAIAEHLGWPDLRAWTPRNLKFNIWLHQDCNAFEMRWPQLKFPLGDPARFFPGYR